MVRELEKIVNTEFLKSDDGSNMEIGTAKTLRDGVRMVSRVRKFENYETIVHFIVSADPWTLATSDENVHRNNQGRSGQCGHAFEWGRKIVY